MVSVSIGIPAHNEANNIGLLLKTLSKQKLGSGFYAKAITIVASGCTDRTEEIVKRSSEFDRRIKLIVERKRRGKASAVNILLREIDSDVLVMEPADTIPQDESLYKLVLPFKDESVGATGGRPIPVNSEHTVIGWIPHMIWDLHHYLAEAENKTDRYFHISGEFCAIRTGIINHIPETVVNDDAYIGLHIKKTGYRVLYVPEAKALMKGPTNIFDLVSQRRRVVYGHKRLEKDDKADVATLKISQIVRTLPKVLSPQPKRLLASLVGISVEGLSHILANKDIWKGRVYHKWRMIPSTKLLMAR